MSIRRRTPALASSLEMPLPRMCQPTRCACAAPLHCHSWAAQHTPQHVGVNIAQTIIAEPAP